MNKNNDITNFIDKLEFVYAILIAWGFASIAEAFFSCKDYWQYLIVCTLVLMRFFFAPSRNLKVIAKATENRLIPQRLLFFCDVPILIAHSLIYYGMCKCKLTDSFLNMPTFYLLFYCVLLPLNVLWLWSISYRMYCFGKGPPPIRFDKWSRNNYVHTLIFVFLFILDFLYTNIDLFGKHLYLLFILAVSNCIVDFVLTAPDYMGFEREGRLKQPSPFRFRYLSA